MSRPKKTAPAAVADQSDAPKLAQAMELVRTDANATTSNAVALAKQFSYEGALTPEAWRNRSAGVCAARWRR